MSLETDYTTVPGQIFACLSVIGPEAPQKNDKFGIKIRGAFATRDEAANHAKRLQKEDPTFDIYVVDMYKWLLIPPDPTKIEDVHYTNEKLEEIMTGYKENQAQAARMFQERKQAMIDTRFRMPLVTKTPSFTLSQMRLLCLTPQRFSSASRRRSPILPWRSSSRRRTGLSPLNLRNAVSSARLLPSLKM
jgi:hypothetical protein